MLVSQRERAQREKEQVVSIVQETANALVSDTDTPKQDSPFGKVTVSDFSSSWSSDTSGFSDTAWWEGILEVESFGL